MGRTSALLGLSTLALVGTAGCDSQFSPFYSGESLLTIVGNVEIAKERRESLVVPALAFTVPEQGEVTIREVSVEGQFPSDFRLDVYQPPPREAYMNATHQRSGEPRMAAAYVTAVSTDHPDTIRTATDQTQDAFGCAPAECDAPCGGKGCLVSRNTYCVPLDRTQPCFVEELYCPTFNSAEEECTLEPISGDPLLKESPWSNFAGFSENYVVVFLEKPARAGSVTAAILGSAENVPAGYGLYSIRPVTPADAAADEPCTQEAEVRAAAGFNAEFGTDLPSLGFDLNCGPGDLIAPSEAGAPTPGADAPVEFAAPFCGGPIDEQDKVDAALDARERYIEREKVELGCLLRAMIVERVEDPAHASVSVSIGPEVQPGVWPNY